MGLLDRLRKALLGEPLPPPGTPQTPGSHDVVVTHEQQPTSDGLTDEHGRKIIPRIEITNLLSHRHDEKLIVTAWVANRSDQRVRIDTCDLLKQKHEFKQEINPGQSRELRLYDGPLPHSEDQHHVQVEYRRMADDNVFRARYRVVYHLEHDNARTVGGLVEDSPVQDVWHG